MRVGLFIPVRNPGAFVPHLVEGISTQTLQPDQILVVDSGNGSDAEGLRACGAEVRRIDPNEFDHGGTRNLAFAEMEVDICIFMTQDAIPAEPTAFARLVEPLLTDPTLGVAFGRQIPHEGAGVFGRHARTFNYPSLPATRRLEDARTMGVRAAFCSNSFAAYRRSAFEQIGAFPHGIIWGEDTYAVARLLEKGWTVRYAADAVVRHSHDYTLRQEFGRYFDAGVFHATEPWYRELLGSANGEGLKFVRSEFRYLRGEGAPLAGPRVLIRNGLRWLGYRTGRAYTLLPRVVSRRISHNQAYWERRR